VAHAWNEQETCTADGVGSRLTARVVAHAVRHPVDDDRRSRDLRKFVGSIASRAHCPVLATPACAMVGVAAERERRRPSDLVDVLLEAR
jgi:hypothetical protein